uniref:Uncharacterized protein n=1 Tax=Spongospora subterranea TaxID=70186 RepID=A0A0H5QPT6_9EUKA|eukprot:CRZ04105.1 hypothetical protein [Spongospora subterranea]
MNVKVPTFMVIVFGVILGRPCSQDSRSVLSVCAHCLFCIHSLALINIHKVNHYRAWWIIGIPTTNRQKYAIDRSGRTKALQLKKHIKTFRPCATAVPSLVLFLLFGLFTALAVLEMFSWFRAIAPGGNGNSGLSNYPLLQ